MTDFLVRKFIKDYNNVEDVSVRTRYGLLSGVVGICCNVVLFAAKLFIGLLIGSISVMADAKTSLISLINRFRYLSSQAFSHILIIFPWNY